MVERLAPIQVDGDLGEWPGPPTIALDREDQVWSQRRDPAMRWLGAADLEGKFWLAYDSGRLWIAGRIRDDGLVPGKVGAEWHQGDAIEVFLDLSDQPPSGEPAEFGPDVVQFFLMPFSAERPWGLMDWRSRPASPSGAGITGIEFVCRREAADVYAFEAALPFHNFPRIAGRTEIGFGIAVDDHDPEREGRYQYVTWNGQQLVDHRENLGRIVFLGTPPLRPDGDGDASRLGWITATAPYVLLPAAGLVVLAILLWIWSRFSRRLPALRPIGRVAGVAMFGAGLLLPGWLVEARLNDQRDRLRAAVDTLVDELPRMEAGLLGAYRGTDRDRTLIELVAGKSVQREKRYRYTMHASVAGDGIALGARNRSYPGLGFEVRPYAIPLPPGEREIVSFRERIRPGRLNLVVARPVVVPGLLIDPIGEVDPADDVVLLDLVLHRADGTPLERAVEVPGPFLPTGDPSLERMEISYRTITVADPLESISLTCRGSGGARLVGITWLSAPDADPEIVPLALGSDTIGGVPTDLRGPWPVDAGVELRENGGAVTAKLEGARADAFQKLWLVFAGVYRARPVDLAVGSHVGELTIRFAEPDATPKVVPFQHQRTMFFELDRANRELPDDGSVRFAHRWEGDDKDARCDFVREVELPAGLTPVALELRNLGPYAIRFRSVVLGSEVREAPTSTADSPLVRDEGGARLRAEILARLGGVDVAVFRNGRLSSTTVGGERAERVVLPDEFRRVVPDDGMRTHEFESGESGDAMRFEAYAAPRGEAWSGSVIAAFETDAGHGEFVRSVNRLGTLLWIASLPILLLLFSEVLATVGSLRVRLVSVLSLASVVPLLLLSVVLVRVVESDHEEKQRERMHQSLVSLQAQFGEEKTQLAAACDACLADLAVAVRTRGLLDRPDAGVAFEEVLRPILQSQIPPSWAGSGALEFEFTRSGEGAVASPIAVFAGAESMRSLDTQLRSETGAYLSWGVPLLGVRRALEIPGSGTCALSVARQLDAAFLANLVRDRAALLCDVRGYPLAASGTDALAAATLEREARRPAAMIARQAVAKDGASGATPVLLRHEFAGDRWLGAYGVLLDVQNSPRLLLGVVGADTAATLPLAVGRVPARSFFAAVAGLLVLVAVFLSYVVTARISKPIERLELGAQALRRGELDVQIESDEPGQIGRLTKTFNQMAQDLRARIDDLHLLNRGVQTLASRLELGEVVGAAVGLCLRQSTADAVRIVLRDRARDRIELLGGSGALPLAASGDVATLMQAVGPFCPRLTAVDSALSVALPGYSSAVAFPLRLAGSTRGALVLLFATPRPLEVDLELLATIAAQTAAATENARLYKLAVEDVRTGALRPDYFATRLADEIASAERDGATVGLGGLRLEDGDVVFRSLGARQFGPILERAVLAIRGELGPDALVSRHGDHELRVAVRGFERERLEASLRAAAARLDDVNDRVPERLRPLRWRIAALAYPKDAASTQFLADALGTQLASSGSTTQRFVREPGPGLVVTSPAMENLVRVIERIAPSDISVLLAGETGTGKEVLTDLIHRWSRRENGPLVKVHCAALPETLLASELFGHEKGSFTGAIDRKLGRFEQADGGTIMLDEIGEVSLDVQVKLLRVLQAREIERVGGTKPIPVDVRVIAATNRDLAQMVAEGKFREDLYYRLQGVLLRVPPLRERRPDIPALVEQFRLEAVAAGQTGVEGFSPDAMDELFRREWRGNVRELRNTVLRAMVLATAPRVTRTELVGLDAASPSVGAAGVAATSGAPVAGPGSEAPVAPPPVPAASPAIPAPQEPPGPPVEADVPREPVVVLPRPSPDSVGAASDGVLGRTAEVLRLARECGSVGSQDCAELLGLSQRSALRTLVELTERGLLVRIGKRRGARYRPAADSAAQSDAAL
ncbi:MAG: sigma 54-interacting transcriptional regulator [Planctomycetes bacterium]|nr:sigma 54-interacting transcriptional regulator [Planctomycetota bacterium]